MRKHTLSIFLFAISWWIIFCSLSDYPLRNDNNKLNAKFNYDEQSLYNICNKYTNEIKNTQIHTLNQYWYQSSKHYSRPNCPNALKEAPKYFCKRKNTADDYLKFKYNFPNITKTLLNLKDKLILFVGDSLTGEMSMTMRCMIESYLGNNSNVIATTRSSAFLGSNFSYSKKYFVSGDPTENLYTNKPIFDYIQKLIISYGKNKTFLILNTGPWWSSRYIKSYNSSRELNNIEILDAFKDHFSQSSPLMKEIKNIVNNEEFRRKGFQIIPIWRDNFPAGICSNNAVKTIYDYHNLFQSFNQIARESFLSNSYLFIPDIWNASLSRFNDHILEHDDFLHYCAYSDNTVFWMANIQLLRLIELVENNSG